MKNKLIRSLSAILALALNACISFKTAPPEWPEQTVEIFLFCREVTEEEGLLDPVGKDDVFSAKDDFVLAFVRLKDVSKKLSLRWKWYGPRDRLIRDTDEVPVGDGTKYLEAVTAYDRIEISPDKTPHGEYTTVLFINGTLSAKKKFTLN